MPSEKAKDARGFQSPSRYVQGPDESKKLPKIASNYGSTVLAIVDTFFYQRFRTEIPEMFAEASMSAYTTEFSGACSDAALDDLLAFCKTLPESPTRLSVSAADRPAISRRLSALRSARRSSWCLLRSPQTRLLLPAPSSTIPANKTVL